MATLGQSGCPGGWRLQEWESQRRKQKVKFLLWLSLTITVSKIGGKDLHLVIRGMVKALCKKTICNGRYCTDILGECALPQIITHVLCSLLPPLPPSPSFLALLLPQYGCCYLSSWGQDHTWQRNKTEMIWHLISTRNFMQERNNFLCF